MRRWFLSYHSPDQALADRLKAALERKDTDAHVFFAPSNLRAGGFWSRALAEEIAQADAFILLVGEKGVGDWQELEYDEALDRRVKSPNFTVVLVLLKGQTAPGFSFLRRMHWIVTAEPASEESVARLIDAVAGKGVPPGELWRYTAPYRGLAAMEEKDSDYFFGRERETVDVLSALAATADRLPVLLGNSGVGKSSLAQAGVLAALKRQAWPGGVDVDTALGWPQAFNQSRRWCFLTFKPGADPIKALVEPFLRTWQYDATNPEWEERQKGWADRLCDGRASLQGLLDATERRYEQLCQPKPPAFFLYIDQGEELYTRGEVHQRLRFSEVIAQGVADPRLYMLMSMRTDFLGELQKDEPLFKVYQKIDVPPLREAQLHEVVRRPAELLSARFETTELVNIITRRTAEDSVKDVGALPLLSYTLDDMWTKMVERADGVLRLPAQSFELGAVLVERANAFLATHPKSQDELRRIFTLKLATVREGEDPTRRRALRSEFTDEGWRLVSELADHPNRLLVTATPEGAETYADVAHEAIFRRWGKLRDWIAAEREFLAWRTGLEAARRAWQATPDSSKDDALLMGLALEQAKRWLVKRPKDTPEADREFIVLSRKVTQRHRRRVQALVGILIAALVGGVSAWRYERELKERIYWLTSVRGHVHTAAMVRALKPQEPFKDCTDCPEMVMVPAGKFMMGPSLGQGTPPKPEPRRFRSRVPPKFGAIVEITDAIAAAVKGKGPPQHSVTIDEPFAVARFELTFSEWDACAARGDCDPHISAGDWGRGRQPVINVTWQDAKRYVAWLSRVTGKPYRLLSEAEWEYAARAGSTSTYSWGDDIKKQGRVMANCKGCGSQYDNQAAPVGSFAPNALGLYDMESNVQEWVEDCNHINYDGAPADGSAWIDGNCTSRVIRGSSWPGDPQSLRLSNRSSFFYFMSGSNQGFRVARTLRPKS